jgi:rhamnosyltransferase
MSDRVYLAEFEADTLEVIQNEANEGLGNGLNAGCALALERGFHWAVTLDQDTELYADFLNGMLEAWQVTSPLTAVLGSNYFNVSRSRYRVPPTDSPQVREQVTVITSGCLTHLPTWSAIGGFRGDYFIDSIDHEFCLRARRAGFVVAINSRPGMSHNIGDKLEYGASIARFLPYRHSVLRKYTSARNSIRTVIDYAFSEPLWGIKKVADILLQLFGILFLEPDKPQRLRAFFLGIMHGCKGRLGSVPESLLRSE